MYDYIMSMNTIILKPIFLTLDCVDLIKCFYLHDAIHKHSICCHTESVCPFVRIEYCMKMA